MNATIEFKKIARDVDALMDNIISLNEQDGLSYAARILQKDARKLKRTVHKMEERMGITSYFLIYELTQSKRRGKLEQG